MDNKLKIINLISILGIGIYELVIDLETSLGVFNSIAYYKNDEKVYLYSYNDGDDFELEVDFEDLSENDQISIVYYLNQIAYN